MSKYIGTNTDFCTCEQYIGTRIQFIHTLPLSRAWTCIQGKSQHKFTRETNTSRSPHTSLGICVYRRARNKSFQHRVRRITGRITERCNLRNTHHTDTGAHCTRVCTHAAARIEWPRRASELAIWSLVAEHVASLSLSLSHASAASGV